MKTKTTLTSLFLLLAALLHGQAIRLVTDADSPTFGKLVVENFTGNQLENLPITAGWQQVFQVFPKEIRERHPDNWPPTLGHFSFKNSQLHFTPRFPFQPGLAYVAELRFDSLGGEGVKVFEFEMPSFTQHEPTELEAIYPSADVLPCNQLKFYFRFSGPMGGTNPLDHIQILDENGRPLEAPFLDLDVPLWSRGQDRLTLWIAPGRIKQGLIPNESLGPVLEPDRRYTLRISEGLTDAFGQPLTSVLEKHFTTIPPDRHCPNPSAWEITPPEAGSLQLLTIRFPEPMDWATLHSAIGVMGPDAEVLRGYVKISEGETVLCFQPQAPWQAGAHKILLNENLEDLAGNNLVRPFDRDVGEALPDVDLELEFFIENRD